LSVIKRWSTGSIGNEYPDHKERNNPNTKGLSYEGSEIVGPGIEGYIEEDEVLASSDNRPLKNLVENDIILDKNISDVASEVDHGIFKNRYNEFKLDILTQDYLNDPEIQSTEFLTTLLRINSGSSIINGKVTRIGNQKILYFMRTTDSSIIFPDYENNTDSILIEINDDNYFNDYNVVYTTISDTLPNNFESYEVKITNKSTINTSVEDRVLIYKIYRDWEDITPLKADSKEAKNEIINFQNDINFGKTSDGYWLKSPTGLGDPIKGTFVTDVKIKKDIEIKDKFLEKDLFTINTTTGKKEYEIITDGIFFNDIQWFIADELIDKSADIQDIYVDENNNIYFIIRSKTSTQLYYKAATSTQLVAKPIRNVGEPNTISVNTRLKQIKNYLFVYGTNGFIRAVQLDSNNYIETPALVFSNIQTTQEITSIYVWNDQIWIAGENTLWHSNQTLSSISNYSTIFPTWTFTELKLNDVVKDLSGQPIVKKITTLERTKGNIIVDTAINTNIFNLVKNGSFEQGTPGQIPTNWNLTDDLSELNAELLSTFEMTQSSGSSNTDRWGNYKGILKLGSGVTRATVYQDFILEENSQNKIYNFSVFLKSGVPQGSTIKIAEYNSDNEIVTSIDSGLLNTSSESWVIDNTNVNTWIRPEIAFRIANNNSKYLRFSINCESASPLQIDGVQLEEINNSGIEITNITCAADIDGSLSGKYLLISSPLHNYYAWINVDMDLNGQGDSIDPKLLETFDGSGISKYPVLLNKTGIQVLISKNSHADVVAEKVAKAINFVSDLVAYRIQNTIQVQVSSEIPGQVADASIATLGSVGFFIDIVVQGLYKASQYIENYEYLFIGFEKFESNRTDQPFAFIDIANPTGPQAIKYVLGKYGNVMRINAAIHDDSNRMYVTDDKRIYTLTFLNNYNMYDRFTMVDISNKNSNELDFSSNIYKFETIAKFNNRIMFGGTVDNRVIKAKYGIDDKKDHTIEFVDALDGFKSFNSLFGETVFVHSNGIDNSTIEFKRTKSCYEKISTTSDSNIGYYEPGEFYTFKILIDGQEDKIIKILSPSWNKGPWTIQKIYEQIKSNYSGSLIDWLNPEGKESVVKTLDWTNPESSSIKTDGFYSIGKQDLTRHVRGNIHKIFIPANQNKTFYIIRGKQIFQSKFDPNVLKDDNGKYPGVIAPRGTVLSYDLLPKNLDATSINFVWFVQDKGYYKWTQDGWEEVQYYTKWDIYSEGIKLTKYKHINDIEKTFGDASNNKVWVDLPIEPGYNLLKGSVRVKTNFIAEVGFTEGEDYFIDYDNNKMIRSDTTNMLLNSEFSYADTYINLNNLDYKGEVSSTGSLPTVGVSIGDAYKVGSDYYRCKELPISGFSSWIKFSNEIVPLNWKYYAQNDTGFETILRKTRDAYDNRNDVAEFIVKSVSSGSEVGVLYQVVDIDYAQDVYTFSVDLKAYNYSKVIIRISECDNSNISSFGYNKLGNSFTDLVYKSSRLDYQIGNANNSTSVDSYDKWNRVVLSHELKDARTTKLRVEIYSLKNNQLYVDKAQLEKNASQTPFVETARLSRIDPNMHVWIDYVEYTTAIKGTDYKFDLATRKIKMIEDISDNEYFYFNYKYNKIFNPYDYGNSKPVAAVNYDPRDDYFILKSEGHIWAINQMFAMISLETEDPLLVSYNYHYPRVDQIKIRNQPDRFGNFIYVVKGEAAYDNPYKPNDIGSGYGINGSKQYYNGVDISEIEDSVNNDILYEINVVDNNYQINDIYDRRIYIDARDNLNYNISLLPETLAYFPFKKDFNSTNGLTPLNFIQNSKIIPIIKNYSILQLVEVGAWRNGYQLGLRTQFTYPGTSFSVFVDPIDGNDTNTGKSENSAFKTVQRALDGDALYSNSTDDYVTNIIITKPSTIKENIEINKPFTVSIVAKSYCYWVGSIQNLTECNIQGVWFKNTAIYPFNKISFYYCTFDNTSINCISPQNISLYNCEATNNHNPLLRVKNTLYPSPFKFPYMRMSERDDGIIGYPDSVATSNNESIAPGDVFNTPQLTASTYIFKNCLIYGSTDHIIKFDPSPAWTGSFGFDFCTIADNVGMFSTPKYNLSINYSNSIISNNREIISQTDDAIIKKVFNCNSSINFDTCYIDFPNKSDEEGSSNLWNNLSGELLGRESCIYSKNVGGSPQFLGDNDYHLKSIAKGSTTDSPVLDKGTGGIDLGCYTETRQQTEQNIPKKLKNYTAYIDEAIHYAMVINSEKITVTLEFKPSGTVTKSGILFDTRTSDDDVDYIVLAYNNNNDNDHNLEQSEGNLQSNPYRFRVIVANKEKSYSIISPIQITTDEEFQIWHRISFTINYEKIINTKPKYDEYNKIQNIIILYHNKQESIESFVKYDLSRYTSGELISGSGNDGFNSWNYNDITKYITIGADYKNTETLRMTGYYDELRIDNRFIDRKQFELWNVKKVQFNDPVAYVNQIPLTKSFNPRTLQEYWSLKDIYDVGSKGNKFLENTSKRMTYEDGYPAWFIGNTTNNIIENSNFSGNYNALLETESLVFDTPIVLTSNWHISTSGSRNTIDEAGFDITILDTSSPQYSDAAGYQDLGLNITDTTVTSSLGAKTFPFDVKINNTLYHKNLILQADPGYQELSLISGVANSLIVPGINPNGTEPEYNLNYKLYDSNNPTGIDKIIPLSISGVNEITHITTVGSLTELKNKYFTLSSTGDSHRYYVWYAQEEGTTNKPTLNSHDPAGQLQKIELTVTAPIPREQINSGKYEGKGFTIYDNAGVARNVYFDESSTLIPVVTMPPLWVGTDLTKVIRVSLTTTSANEGMLTPYIAEKIQEAINPVGQWTVTLNGSTLTIENKEKVSLSDVNLTIGNSSDLLSVNKITEGCAPIAGFDTRTGIMALISSTDDQDAILLKTKNAFTSAVNTDIMTAEKINGNVEEIEITFNSGVKNDYDSKYFTLTSNDQFGFSSNYYVWFNAGIDGDKQVTRVTCNADETLGGDPSKILNNKYFTLPTNSGENYFWYNANGLGRDPGQNHLAIKEEFTLSFGDDLKDKNSYHGKYFTLSTPIENYCVYYTVNGVDVDLVLNEVLDTYQKIRIDIGSDVGGLDQRSTIMTQTKNVLRAQVSGFVDSSISIQGNVMSFSIPEGKTRAISTTGSFSDDITYTRITIGMNTQTKTYQGAGLGYVIAISENDSANAITVATQSVINNTGKYDIVANTNILTITNKVVGKCSVFESNTGFTIISVIGGVNSTTNPNILNSIGVEIDITDTLNAVGVASAVNSVINNLSDFNSTILVDTTKIKIVTTDDEKNFVNPSIGNLGETTTLDIINHGKLPYVKFTNTENGVVTTKPTFSFNGTYEITQTGIFANTGFGNLITILNQKTLNDLTWSIIGGKLRATTVSQGVESTIEIINTNLTNDLIKVIGFNISPKVYGLPVDDDLETVLYELNKIDSRIHWEFITKTNGKKDIRAILTYKGQESLIKFEDTGNVLDLFTKLGVVYNNITSFDGFSKITLYNQYQAEELVKQVFSKLRQEKKTDIDCNIRNQKLIIFTDDFITNTITVDFKNDYAKLFPARNQITSVTAVVGNKNHGVWNVNLTNITPVDDTVSYNYDKEYNKYSENSLVVEKKSSDALNINISQYIMLKKETDYTLSTYVYSEDYLSSNNIKFKFTNEELDWDNIERLDGNWWRLVYSFKNEYAGQYHIGLVVIKTNRMYIDAVQFEENKFMTPFVLSSKNDIGKLGINKSLLNKKRGTLFFKFKPYFDYYKPTITNPRVIINMPTIDDNIVDQSLGFKVIYYFDPIKNRGIFEFSINNEDSSSWKLEAIESFFNQWHSIGFVYDYINDRFIYWFDYFNNIIDSPFNNYEWANLWIGHNGLDSSSMSADIVVKDIVIQNYTTTDSEILNWNTTYEFFNTSLFNSTIQEVKNELLGLKQGTLSNSDLSLDLQNQLAIIENRVDEYDSNEVDNLNYITKLSSFIGYPKPLSDSYSEIPSDQGNHENRIKGVEITTTFLNGKNSVFEDRLNYALSEVDNVNNSLGNILAEINTEKNTRSTEDQAIKNLYASTSINKGASLVGIYDVNGRYSAINVEDILQEIAGGGRTTESLKSLKDDISSLELLIGQNDEDFEYIKDGNTQLLTRVLSQSAGYNVFDIKNDLTTLENDVSLIRDNNKKAKLSSQKIIVNFTDSGSFVPLLPETVYSFIVNGKEFSIITPEENVTWNSLITNFLPNATSADNELLSLKHNILRTSDNNISFNILIENKADIVEGFTVDILPGITEIDLLISLSAGVGIATSTQINFIPLTMNNASMFEKINTEITDRQNSISAIRNDLSNDTLVAPGASLIGINSAGIFTSTTVQQALEEISGIERNSSMTIAGNYNNIQGMLSSISTLQSNVSNSSSNIVGIKENIQLMKDGNLGITWDGVQTIKPNLMDLSSRLGIAEDDIISSNTAIGVNALGLANTNQTLNNVSNNLTTEITNRVNGDSNIMQQLASSSVNKGASLIAIQDVAGKYTATTVEGALAEVDTKLAALAGALSWQSPVASLLLLPTTGNIIGNARTV